MVDLGPMTYVSDVRLGLVPKSVAWLPMDPVTLIRLNFLALVREYIPNTAVV